MQISLSTKFVKGHFTLFVALLRGENWISVAAPLGCIHGPSEYKMLLYFRQYFLVVKFVLHCMLQNIQYVCYNISSLFCLPFVVFF